MTSKWSISISVRNDFCKQIETFVQLDGTSKDFSVMNNSYVRSLSFYILARAEMMLIMQ